jgi:hypothetical protein
METLGTSVGILSKKMVAAAEGNKAAAASFAEAGIAVKNADGSLRSSSDVLADLADKFASLPDGAQKTALAMELLGKGGKDMIPLLNGGADALAKLKAEADTFGQVFTAEMGANAEAFNDNITRLQGTFGNLAADLTAKVLPYLTQFSEWLVQNGPQLVTNAGNFIDFAAKVVSALGTIKPALDAFSDGMHLVVQGITAAGTAATTLATQINQGFTAVVATIQAKVGEIRQALVGFRDQFVQMGRDLIDGLIQGIRERVSGAVDAVKGVASSVISAAKSALGIQSPSTVFAEIGQNIMQGLSGGLSSMQGGVESDVSSFASSLANTFAGVLTGAQDFRSSLSSILSQAGGSLIQSGLGGLGKLIGVPGFAKGTGFAPGGLALVGERGPEVVDLPRGSRVTPNHRLNEGGQVAVRVYVEQDGNWRAAVAGIAGPVSAQVVKQMAPGVVANAQIRGR